LADLKEGVVQNEYQNRLHRPVTCHVLVHISISENASS